MSIKRKRLSPPQAVSSQQSSRAGSQQVNGLYIHSSPPRVLQMNPSIIRQWLRGGDVEKLEQVVLEGQGHKLVGEYSPDPKVRAFLKSVPSYMAKMEMLHEAVNRGQLSDMQTILGEDPRSKKLALCKDNNGVGLLHKAVYYDQQPIVNWLTENFPNTTALKDREGRTALHYCAVSKTPQAVWEKLVAAGADPSVVDNRAHDAAYYIEHPQEVELPDTRKLSGAMRRFTSGKDGFVVTRANIRIWIHDRDLGRLQQMLWEGHGDKLRVETSNSPRVKRLLDAVPYIMGTIKDVHKGAVTDDLELFQKRSADPVPANILASKDHNGLNPLHKAAGLGHTNIVQDILARNPKALSMADNDGKLPLHYAAALKDDGQMYNLLVEAGADEQALDNRGKPATYYRHRPGEIDGSLLKVIPDAPRTASVFPPAWDWRLLNSMTYDFGPVPVDADEAGDSDSKHGVAGGAALAAGATGALGIAPAANLHRATPTGGQKAAEIMDDEDEGVGEEGEQDDELERQRAQEEADREEREREEREREEAERLEQEEAERQAQKEAEREEQEKAERLAAEEQQREEEERLQKEEEERQQQEEEERLQQVEEERQRQEEEERQRQEEEEEQRQRQKEEEEAEEERQRQKEEEEVERLRQDEEERQRQEEEERQREDEEESHRQEKEEEEEVQRQEEEERPRREEEERLQLEEEERLRVEEERLQQEAGREEEHPAEAERWVREEEDEGEGEEDQEDPQVAEVRQLIAEGNMEQLATMVLNGEGERLVGMKSDDPEIQTFLNNVPSYMAKINTVQAAAREGRLRDLQAALDRRRFAVARENSTPLNVTPLHVAVLFTRADVARYLGGRFPETLNVPDSDNRTPLHYAATLADNGHMYNLLLNLGANPTLKDNRGRTAEYYLTHRDRLTHKKLLSDYGASESIADDTFGDKVPNDTVTSRRDLEDADTLATLERCYELVLEGEVVNGYSETASVLLRRHLKRPVFNRLRTRVTRMDHTLLDVLWPEAKKLPTDDELDEITSHNGGVVAPDYESYVVFSDLLLPIVKDLHGLIVSYDLYIHPGIKYLEDDNDDDDDDEVNTDVKPVNIDPSAKWVTLSRVECSRNLSEYQLPASLSLTDLMSVERKIHTVLEEISLEDEVEDNSNAESEYHSLADVLGENSEIRTKLSQSGLLIPLSDSNDNYDNLLNGKHWPNGRGVYVSADGNLAAWINVQEHLRILFRPEQDKPGNIGQAYHRLCSVMSQMDKKLNFRRDPSLGFLAARPRFLGNGLQFSINAHLPNLGKSEDNLRQLSSVRGLNIRKLTDPDDTFQLTNRQNLGITEIQTFRDFTTAASNIIELEKNFWLLEIPILQLATVSGSDSQQLALLCEMFAKLFVTECNEYTCQNHLPKHGYNQLKDITECDNSQTVLIFTLSKALGLFNHSCFSNIYSVYLVAAVRSQVEPVFWTEEGRYLAASLGDPLIKGLMEVAEVRPSDPIAYLAAYLYNFANKNKSRAATQESEVLITTRSEEPPSNHVAISEPTHSAIHRPLASPDLDDEDDPRPPSPDDAYSSANRDEHGQSMLHFAAARSHGRNALFQLLQETQINVGYRDELYRTARDVAIQANLPDNIHEIDMWVLYLAANGETQKLTELLLEGYDHITDIEDDEDNSIQNVVEQRKFQETLEFLESIPEFEERRERLHRAIRQADMQEVQELLASQADNLLAISKNMYGRCSLHVAVLCQDEQLTEFISGRYPQTLRVGDNLERTALHYAMGVDKVEDLSTILIKAGAKRVLKDLKGRQPSYYFMNKSDILRLQDDEDALKL
ncbi:uncharacterized protein [Anabrus simplex]|uniref:uncharacterized protein n=1 Tax=Anabrus simplex TaxID=316456 RepID=UPI0035A3A980